MERLKNTIFLIKRSTTDLMLVSSKLNETTKKLFNRNCNNNYYFHWFLNVKNDIIHLFLFLCLSDILKVHRPQFYDKIMINVLHNLQKIDSKIKSYH